MIDPIRGPVVMVIFDWYCTEGIGYGEICDRLNADPNRFPPPLGARRLHSGKRPRWELSTVRAILRNPKYTGFNVWNRHDKRPGRPTMRPRDQWIWSKTPTHPALVPLESYESVQPRADANNRRKLLGVQEYAGDKRRTDRFYVLRGRLFCDLCGARMEGSHQKLSNYMRCLYAQNHGVGAAQETGHPKSLQVKEQIILDEVLDFLIRRVFGPDRLALLRDDLTTTPTGPWAGEAKLATLRTEVDKVERAMDNQGLAFDAHPPGNRSRGEPRNG